MLEVIEPIATVAFGGYGQKKLADGSTAYKGSSQSGSRDIWKGNLGMTATSALGVPHGDFTYLVGQVPFLLGAGGEELKHNHGEEWLSKIWNTKAAVAVNSALIALNAQQGQYDDPLALIRSLGFAAVSTSYTLDMEHDELKRRLTVVAGAILILVGTSYDALEQLLVHDKFKAMAFFWALTTAYVSGVEIKNLISCIEQRSEKAKSIVDNVRTQVVRWAPVFQVIK